MGSGTICTIGIAIFIGLAFCGLVFCLVNLIYNSIEERSFSPTHFWLSIGFSLLLAISILTVVDMSKHESKLEAKYLETLQEQVDPNFIETKIFTVTDLTTNTVYEGLTDGKFISGSACFKVSENKKIYFTGPILIEEEVNITRK